MGRRIDGEVHVRRGAHGDIRGRADAPVIPVGRGRYTWPALNVQDGAYGIAARVGRIADETRV